MCGNRLEAGSRVLGKRICHRSQAQEIVRFAFSELHLDELVSFTARDNVRSEKLMKRLGMIYEKDFDLLLFPPEHPHRRHLLYKLTRQQWQTRIGLHPVP